MADTNFASGYADASTGMAGGSGGQSKDGGGGGGGGSGGGGFQLNSVTPTAFKNDISVTAGNIFGSGSFFPQKTNWNMLALIAAGAVVSVALLFVLRKG